VFAGVERVRFRRDLDTDNRVLLPVGPFHFLFAFGIGSRFGQEFEVARRVKKDDFVVGRMDFSFHGCGLSFRKGFTACEPLFEQVGWEPAIMHKKAQQSNSLAC
jgi:hypothetical protein